MRLNKILQSKIRGMVTALTATIASLSTKAYASGISSSKIATGTQKLISDATSWLLVIAPTVTVLLIIYYLIRKGMSDEMEHKKWNSRIMVAIVSFIGAVVASVLINVLVSYYQ